jgi:diguanylate cyclase (GGDEF)-like protein/PAS domain S-box-containing protein
MRRVKRGPSRAQDGSVATGSPGMPRQRRQAPPEIDRELVSAAPWSFFESAARLARLALEADAVTIAARPDAEGRLLVSRRHGVRIASGSISLGLIQDGARILAGGAGVLQAAECASLLGFAPTGYLGARFASSSLGGGIAAWSSTPRDWSDQDAELIREVAALCVRHVDSTAAELARGEPQPSPAVPAAASCPAAASEATRSDGRYRQLFERCSDAIFVTDLDGRFLEANPAALNLFGFEHGIGDRCVEDCYLDSRDWGQLLQQITSGEELVEMEVRFRHSSGASSICLLSASPWLDETGEVVGQQSVARDISERKQMEERLRMAALHDPLTGLPNRALFIDRVEQAMARIRRRPQAGFAVVFLDLDRFKRINDSLGHHRGDELLIATSRRLESCLRSVDTVARIGGDEFAVLLEDISSVHAARRLVERMIGALTPPFLLTGHEVFVRASIGLAMGGGRYNTPAELLRDADAAMYLSRRPGAEGYQVFDEEMRQEWAQQLQLETDLRRALERDQLRLHFQPLVALDTGRITGFEALLRWEHPERGLLFPADFMEVAEESGLIVSIGSWVVTEACRQLGEWQRARGDAAPLTISVNVSGRQIRPDFIPILERIPDQTGCDLGKLRLEITESVLMADTPAAAQVFQELARLGIRVEIDDFGTGYSSLGYLHRFRVDAVKIDRRFVRGMSGEASQPEIVSSIVGLAKNLGVPATAEGIETADQLERLRNLGCGFGQGFLFAPALEPAAAFGLLQSDPRW